MTATERLRRLLDERGIEHDDEFVKSAISYCDGYEGTYWGGDSFGYVEPIRPKPNTIGSHPKLIIHDCTPEQAIAATMGDGKLTAEQVRELIAPHLHARLTFDFGRHGAVWKADFQAIADELNTTLGGGECEMEYGGDVTEGTAKIMGVYFCSECGSPTYNDCMPHFCIYCGKAVKR